METSFTHARTPNVAREPAEGATAFGLFVLLNAVLFVRPAEIFISLEGLPLYELLILTCLMATMPRLWQGLSLQRLRAQPITGCVIGLLFAVAMSHLSHFDLYGARLCTMQFLKIVAYFFLLVTVIDSAPRFRLFCLFLVAFIGIATLLALLQYHGFVHIASLEAIQENDYDAANDSLNSFYRLCSTGIFNDPNDLSLILVVGIALATYFVTDRQERLRRGLWAAGILAFGYALLLTRSRGGLIAMVVSILAFFCTRYGLRKTIVLSTLVLPALTAFAGGRQANIDLEQGTGQARIQLWSDGLVLMKTSPLFGIGMDRYVEEVGLVAHNSYIHAYTELGLIGGTMFVGAFYLSLRAIYLLGKVARCPMRSDTFQRCGDHQMLRLRPYLLAAVCGYVVGMLTLSRVYVVPTYLVLGLSASYIQTADAQGRQQLPRFSARLFIRLALVGMIFLTAAYIFIRVTVRRS